MPIVPHPAPARSAAEADESIAHPPTAAPAATLALLRAVLLGAFVFTVVGTLAELLLLEHYDDPWQWTPLVLLVLGLLVLGWYGLRRSAASLRAFQGLMVCYALAGGLGLLLHYRGNVEFELERHPSLAGLPLFWEAIRGATPALAPGTMVQLAIIGLAFTFRHPALARPGSTSSQER